MLDITKILPQFKPQAFEVAEVEEELEIELGDRQQVVYDTLKRMEDGATAKELSVHLYQQGKVMSNERNSVHPRLNELIQLGLVQVSGKKTCQYTDRKVSIYKVK